MTGRTAWRLATAATLVVATGCYESSTGPGDGGGDADAPRDGEAAPDAPGEADAPPDEAAADDAADLADAPDVPGGDDAGDSTAGPWPVRFVFRFISDIPESIWVNETDPAWVGGHWLVILRDSAPIAKADNCGVCECEDCPACAVCGAPLPTVGEIPSGGSREWRWSGNEWRQTTCPGAPPAWCEEPVAAPAGSYAARFCWSTTVTGTPPSPAEVGELTCEDVPFDLPDYDGVVEYVLNWGG
jgi:hypothetical protein